MTIIEVSSERIYCSTDDRNELLELIIFIQRNFERMKSRDQKAITIFDFRDGKGEK